MKKTHQVEQASGVYLEQEKTSNALGQIIYVFSSLVILIAIMTLGVFFYWSIVPSTTLVIKNNPVPVEKKRVESKGVQVIDIDYCKNSDIKGNVEWSLISNKQVILLPSYVDTNPRGCNANLRAPILLPPIKFNDVYHFHYVVTYQTNPLKTETIIFDSQPFMIIGLDGK